MLPSGAWESAARREGGRIPDPRVTRYFDRDARLGHLYGPIIHLPEGLPAWDVYFVFAPAVRWEDKPPAPTYWMHQLGRRAPPELRLDGDQMARVVSELLATAERESHKAAAHRAPLDASLLTPPIRPSILPVVVASLEKQGVASALKPCPDATEFAESPFSYKLWR